MLTSTRFISSFAALAFFSILPSLVRAQEAGSETLSAPIVAPSDSGAYHAINQLPASIRSSEPFAREFYEFARHAGSSGTVDNAAYQRAFQEAREDMLQSSERAMKGTSTQNILSGTWTNIGLTGADTVQTAGITRAIAFDPQDPAVMYAGGNGGVWKSTDTGTDWFPLTDDVLPNLSVNTIAVDPVTPDILYVGTGNCEIGVPPYNGTGLYKSTDGGQSFALLNASGISFVKVVVDPSNHNIVLASSYDKGLVYRSSNSGTSWQQVPTTSGTGVQGLAWDIIATPAPNSVFYLSSQSGIFKSTDDGVTWAKTTSSTNYVTNIGRSALASPANAPNKIFALVTDPGGSQSYFYESTDAASSWKALYIPNDIFIVNAAHTQGWYDLSLAVSPYSVQSDTLHDTIYADGVIAYFKHGALGWDPFSDYNHSDGGNGYPHVDHHSFAINPVNPNIVYDGDDGGLWVNYAAGSNDASIGGGWRLHSHNMITNRFYHFGFAPRDTTITWAGAQDQGMWKMKLGGVPTQNGPFGDAMQPLVSAQNSSLIYGEGPQAQIDEFSNGSWSPIADSAAGLRDADGWDNPFRMSPISHGGTPSSSIIYLGRQHVWQTTNGGNNWTKLSPSYGGTPDGVEYCSAIGLPNWNANLIYAAGGGSSLQLSTDFGVSWHARVNPGYVTSINTNWTDPKFIVVSLSSNAKRVEMSDDSGKTWTDASGAAGASLPSANVMSLAIDSLNPLSTWYAATDFGLYATTDAGQHWGFAGPGLFPCRDVQLASNKVTMRVATFGRGIWEITLPVAFNGVELTSLSATKGPQGASLSWYVEGEPAGAMYYIQRSVDGDAFQNIGSVPGFGASEGRQDYSFSDNTTTPGTYLYQIHEVDANGAERYTNHVELHYGTDGINFSQPYPNPFILGASQSAAITLQFETPARDNVLVRIYNTNGSLLRTLLAHPLDGGPHSLTWDARDDAGDLVAPGAYLCSIQTGTAGTVTNKIMIVRQ